MPCLQIKYITMKRLMISLLALYLASSVNAQNVSLKDVFQKQVEINAYDVREMINTIDEVLFWHSEDAAECNCMELGSYEEEWGSNYWLRVIRDQLYDQLQTQVKLECRVEVDCENCDEID